MSLVRFLPVTPTQIGKTSPPQTPQIRLPVKPLLPVRSVLPYRCVGKNWNTSLITSSFSDKEQLHHNENPTRLIIPIYNGPDPTTTIHLFPHKIVPGVTPVPEKPSYLQIPAKLDGIIGPVDGIFFLHKDFDRMALWNPATREFRPLPRDFFDSIPETSRPINYYNNYLGFGFDPSNHDYKVVCVSFLTDMAKHNPEPDRLWFASVCSLNNNCWKFLDCNFHADPLMSDSLCSTCVNGFYYWLTESYISPRKSGVIIRYFDMHNEVFGEIPGPIDYTSNQHCELSINKDSICLLVYHHHNRHDDDDDANPIIDVWLLNDDRSWTKVVNLIPTRIELRNVVPTMTCWTVGFWDQDKFIFESENEIIHFDTKTREFTPLLDKPKQVCDRAALSYKESRVSIKGDILNHMQEFFEEYSEDDDSSEDEDCKIEDSKDDE